MNHYKIITDSTSDLSAELVAELDLAVISLTFTIEGREYRNTPDEADLSSQDFYKLLRHGKTSTTSQINSETFKEAFLPYLKAGQDILYPTPSSLPRWQSGSWRRISPCKKSFW